MYLEARFKVLQVSVLAPSCEDKRVLQGVAIENLRDLKVEILPEWHWGFSGPDGLFITRIIEAHHFNIIDFSSLFT